MIQGFGAVGAHGARYLKRRLPEVHIVGISDISGYLFDPNGLPVETLFNDWVSKGAVTKSYFQEKLTQPANREITQPNIPVIRKIYCVNQLFVSFPQHRSPIIWILSIQPTLQ